MSESFDGYTISLKSHKGYESPLVVIRGNTLEEVEDRLAAFADSGIPATIGRAAKALETGTLLGHKLDAESDNKAVEPAKKKPAAKKTSAKPKDKPEPEPEEQEAVEEKPKAAPKKAPAAKKAGGPPRPMWAS